VQVALDVVFQVPERIVPEFAHELGISRTYFSQRFRRTAGELPMRYLARVRLSRAAG
jgi:AraC-like DNA-binding protein